MSESKLRKRLTESLAATRRLALEIDRSPASPPPPFGDRLSELVSNQTEIESAIRALDARDTVRALLEGFEAVLDRVKNQVILGDLPAIDADQARFLVVQSYLAATWTVSDGLTSAAGRIRLPRRQGRGQGPSAETLGTRRKRQ